MPQTRSKATKEPAAGSTSSTNGIPEKSSEANTEQQHPPPAKRRRKETSDETSTTAKPIEAAVERQTESIKNDDDSGMLKIISWNVAGIRAACKKTLPVFFQEQKPDVICLSEVKATKGENPFHPAGYHVLWSSSVEKKGYSGVSVMSRQKPIRVDYGIGYLDGEARCIVAEFERYTLVHTYVPNAGQNLKFFDKRMKWDDKFRAWFAKLQADKAGKPIVWSGDMNVAHLQYDVYDGETNKQRPKTACFTPQERENFGKLLEELDLIDAYRHLHPDERQRHFTFFTHRSAGGAAKKQNNGWRLDYFVVSKALADRLEAVDVVREENSSDHVPLVMKLRL